MLLAICGLAACLTGAMLVRHVGGAVDEALPEWELVRAATRGRLLRASSEESAAEDGAGAKKTTSAPAVEKKKADDFCPT